MSDDVLDSYLKWGSIDFFFKAEVLNLKPWISFNLDSWSVLTKILPFPQDSHNIIYLPVLIHSYVACC